MDFAEGDQREGQVCGAGYGRENEGDKGGGIEYRLFAVVGRHGDCCVNQAKEGGEETRPVGSNGISNRLLSIIWWYSSHEDYVHLEQPASPKQCERCRRNVAERQAYASNNGSAARVRPLGWIVGKRSRKD